MRRNSLRRNILFTTLGLIAPLLCCPHGVLAQTTAIFEAVGPTKEVAEGTRFELAFSLKNTTAKRFIPPDFNGFRVTGGPSELRGAGFINGKSYSHQTWTYELEAGPPGTYTIGTATVQTATQTLRTQPLVIRVVKAPSSRTKVPPSPDDRLFISAELDRETAWLGQQLLYQIKLYTQVGISDYDILDLPAFEGFFTQERRRFDTRTQYQTIKGKRYVVRILHEMSLFPQRTGALRIGTAQVRLGVEQPGSLSALLGGKRVLLQTQPIKIQINPLPEPIPENFSGGVGAYAWQVSADREALSTDNALTLSVRIEGNGDARRFADPKLELPAGLEGFEPKILEQEEYETGEQFVHARTLEYVILPKEPGEYSLQPELIVFDPDSNKYRRLTASDPINMHVTAGQFYGKDTALPDTTNRPAPATRSLFAGLWEKIGVWLNAPLLGSLAGILVLVAFFIYWRRRSKHKVTTPLVDPADIPPARPNLKSLRQRLKTVSTYLRNKDSQKFHHELLKVTEGYISIFLNTEPGLLSKEEVREKLALQQLPEPTINNLMHIWQTCEQAVFSGQPMSADMNNTWYQAETTLSQLDRMLK